MTIRILILGEGATDVGVFDGAGRWLKGCVLKLVEKVNTMKEINYIPVEKKVLPKTLPKKGQRKFDGHGKVVQKLIFYSQLKNLDYGLIIYYGDIDKESGTKNTRLQAAKASEQAYKQAYAAFEFFNKKGIAIIPLRMLESWLLADEQAFYKSFGHKVRLPKDPELLWGDKHDPKSNYPKNLLTRILNDTGKSCNRQAFCELVENMDLNILERKCPISFPPFIIKANEYLVD